MANKAEQNNQKPDFRKVNSSTFNKGNFPISIEEEYRVNINEEAYANMKAHAETTVKVELCGILVGNVFKDEKGIFLKIDAVIEGRDASSQGAQVTFTHQTWNHINDVMDKKYPNKQIVGWYHTHPGFGVFLSGMDLFIQENFFNQPYQVAIVLETHIHKEGCFVWVDGVSTPLERYWVGNKEIKLAGREVNNLNSDTALPEKNQYSVNQVLDNNAYANYQNNRPISLQSLLIAMLLILLGFFMGQVVGLGNFKKLVYESIESELYSIQEYAATNAVAKDDMQFIQGELTALNSENISAEEKAKKNTELQEHLKKLIDKYSEARITYRKKLEELKRYKSSLATRVNENSMADRNLEDLVSELYLLRLIDLARNVKRDENNKVSQESLKEMGNIVQKVLEISPEKKQLLLLMFPDLMEAFYPTKSKNTTNEQSNELPKN